MAKAWLSEQQVEFDFRNIAKEPPTETELRQIAELGGFKLTQLVNTKGQAYRKLKPDLNDLNDTELISLIQSNPTIMLRPVLTDGQRLIIGFKEEEYKTIL